MAVAQLDQPVIPAHRAYRAQPDILAQVAADQSDQRDIQDTPEWETLLARPDILDTLVQGVRVLLDQPDILVRKDQLDIRGLLVEVGDPLVTLAILVIPDILAPRVSHPLILILVLDL
jgi:hypothetical protein